MRSFFRPHPARPTSPVPGSNKVPGSGTDGTLGLKGNAVVLYDHYTVLEGWK